MVEISRLYTRERFDKLRHKFASVDEAAESIIEKAEPKDILSLQITISSPRKVISAEITSPKEFLKSCIL